MGEERRTVWQRIASGFDTTVRTAHPEASGGSPGATFRNVLVAVLVVVITGLAAFGWDWVTAEVKARHDADIAEEIEADRRAQAEQDDTAGRSPEDGADADPGDAPEAEPEPEPDPTEDEEPEPFDPGIWSYVEALAPGYPGPGRLLLDDLDADSVATFRSADYDEPAFNQLLDWAWSVGTPVYATFGQDPGLSNRWNVTLNSDGATAVTVTDLQLADLECEPARATAAFDLPAQGANDRLLISYSMENPTEGRLYEYTDSGDQAPGWGEPFFEQQVVNIGGNEEGVGLVVEVVTTDQDCTWSAFELSYEGPDGGGTYLIANDDEEPFEARGVAADADTFFMFHDDGGPDIYANPLW